MKKGLLVLIMLLTISLTGCSPIVDGLVKGYIASAEGKDKKNTADTETQTDGETTPSAPDTQVPEPAPNTQVPEPALDTQVPEPTPDTQVPEPAPEPAPTTNALGDKYVDLDNRSFTVNGKIYTLGVNTLQEMIDDGVPFEADDISHANDVLNKNTESMGFNIVLGDYYFAQIHVANLSDGDMKNAECKLSEIYFPVQLDKSQDILAFAFPLTITVDELIANAGQPTDTSDYSSDDGTYVTKTLEYKKESTNYYRDTGYEFEFANGELKYFTMTFLD